MPCRVHQFLPPIPRYGVEPLTIKNALKIWHTSSSCSFELSKLSPIYHTSPIPHRLTPIYPLLVPCILFLSFPNFLPLAGLTYSSLSSCVPRWSLSSFHVESKLRRTESIHSVHEFVLFSIPKQAGLRCMRSRERRDVVATQPPRPWT